jgi:hypothetical protein
MRLCLTGFCLPGMTWSCAACARTPGGHVRVLSTGRSTQVHGCRLRSPWCIAGTPRPPVCVVVRWGGGCTHAGVFRCVAPEVARDSGGVIPYLCSGKQCHSSKHHPRQGAPALQLCPDLQQAS